MSFAEPPSLFGVGRFENRILRLGIGFHLFRGVQLVNFPDYIPTKSRPLNRFLMLI